jgi:hypothetical protein|tara:strand:+ start:435 stop:704 length:270 start_codon:yes stop_codon:yes gene_type:complete
MRKVVAIKEGQLCEFNGATVRVIKPTNNNMWLVGTHGQLWGFAKEEDLTPVSRRKERAYTGEPSLFDKALGAVGLLSVALVIATITVLS